MCGVSKQQNITREVSLKQKKTYNVAESFSSNDSDRGVEEQEVKEYINAHTLSRSSFAC